MAPIGAERAKAAVEGALPSRRLGKLHCCSWEYQHNVEWIQVPVRD